MSNTYEVEYTIHTTYAARVEAKIRGRSNPKGP